MKYLLTLMLLLSACVTGKSTEIKIPYADVKGIVVIEYGAEWCHACQEIKPILKEMHEKYSYKFVYIDSDTEFPYTKDFIEYHRLFLTKYVPVLTVIKNGKIYYHGQWTTRDDFEFMIQNLM